MSGAINLTAVLMAVALFLPAVLMASTQEAEGTFPLLDNAESWAKLPSAREGSGQAATPSWARALAGPMPRTTAAALAARSGRIGRDSPLDPKLRAADALDLGSRPTAALYAEAYAAADARRAGLDDRAIDALRRSDDSGRSPAEKTALEFAREMTVDSAGVTDAEFAALVAAYGERKVAAMVLLMAHANFQDRLSLMPSCADGSGRAQTSTRGRVRARGHVRRHDVEAAGESGAAAAQADGEGPDRRRRGGWTSFSYEQLQARLEEQKRKPTRLRIPSWEEVERGLPPGFMKPSRIVWNQVCLGYQPELATAWETIMRTNAAESRGKVDRVFSLSVFWIVTRAIDCPYCMGHCEMNWEVAGLSPPLIAERSRLLAGDDWSSFRPPSNASPRLRPQAHPQPRHHLGPRTSRD